MKTKRSFFSSAHYWNKLVHKFYNLNNRISELLSGNNSSKTEVNILLGRLQKLFKKLKRLQVKTGVKIAGSALALMLATTSVNAQNFVQTGLLQNRINVKYGSTPYFNDIDNDGNTDLILGEGNGHILIYNQDDDGLFKFNDTLRVSGVPIDIGSYAAPTMADIDGDGDLDLYVGNNHGYILFFERQGDNFLTMDTLKADGSYIDLGNYTLPTFADLDGDGDLDIYAGSDAGYVYMFTNDGGNFSANGIMQADGSDISLYYTAPTFSDIDDDGDLDLIVGIYYGYLMLYPNNGNNTFAAGDTLMADGVKIEAGYYPFPTFVDIDGDGDEDLYLGFDYGYIEVFENEGSGNLFPAGNMQEVMGSAQNGIAIGDVDADGDLDIILGSDYTSIKIFKKNSNEFVLESQISTTSYSNKPTLADLDANGTNELYVGIGTGFIQIFSNNGSGGFALSDSLRADGELIDMGYNANPVFGDLDDDGDLDLFVGDVFGYVFLFENDGSNNFSARGKVQADGIDISVYYYAAPTFADIDYDGDVDMVVSDYYGYMHLYKNDGIGNLYSEGNLQNNGEVVFGGYFSDPEFASLNGTCRNLYSGENFVNIFHQTPTPAVETLNNETGECSVDAITPPQAHTSCNKVIDATTTATFPITENTSITWVYTDSLGFETSQMQNIVITDTESPTISCIGNQTVDADNSHTYIVNMTEFDPTDFADNCEVDTVYNDFNDNSTLAGAGIPEGTTTITWYVGDAHGNITSCSFDVLVNAFTSVTELSDNISIYPNPTTGLFTIENTQGYNIEIVDIKGKLIKQFTNVDETKLDIDFSNQPSGVYFVKLFNTTEVKTSKIIIE